MNYRMTAMHSGVWSELYIKCDCRVSNQTVLVQPKLNTIKIKYNNLNVNDPMRELYSMYRVYKKKATLNIQEYSL